MTGHPPASDVPERESKEKTDFFSRLLTRLFRDKILFWVLLVILVPADLWTKKIVISHVNQNAVQGTFEKIPVVWVAEDWFGLVSVNNRGGPWGVGSDFSGVLKVVRIAALGVILFLLFTTPRRAWIQVTALAMIMSGALGNIWDTLTIGSVRDFLYFDFDIPPADPWPAFNLADSLICVGVVLLATLLCVDWARDRKRSVEK